MAKDQKKDEKKTPIWNKYTEAEKKALHKLNEGYKAFLSQCKTERESVVEAVKQAEKAGYRNLDDIVKSGKKLSAGDKVYAVCMGKAIAMFNIGTESLEDGMAILGAHIDTCRLDLKQNPLYESDGMAYFDTHYYGGIKKYQWVTLPLALHGVVARMDGTVQEIVIGEEEGDPVFCVTDLLIHLSQEQMEKKASKVVTGENLDILIGSYPLKGEEKDAVKAGILKLLKDKYQIEEDDFISAELTMVPAGKARDLGLDRSMVLAYGHDDRVCAYTSLVAMLETKKVKRTACCLLVDKEEIGSVGATGMQSRFFENTVAELLHALGGYSGISLRRCLANSWMLSSDVSSAYDSLYASAFDKKNVAYPGKGMVFNKFTGRGGKSGSNDASAEYLGRIRAIMKKHKVTFQTAELGRVDLGGGGTIAYIMALYGMNVIDSGVAVLSMHAPWEAVSKVDVYETMKGYKAFLQEI
ncbi:putative M18-family aminopeptidase 1 [Anaerovibrio sp. JC8]|uniref:aminopeptidase n=1 Tax=Anaerovibrio sp. JC8 TaxID=1240085 RepID=UPI000A0D334E|nr:aminopeptidase [Anaerovibrio sp. JC8]ORU00445.1 putative M18-family aminopeptidase 1 [Anaerovibrio sp. JC8]